MRPLLQHASRTLTANAASVASSSTRPIWDTLRQTPSICLRCQYMAVFTSRSSSVRPWSSAIPKPWSRRSFSASARWSEGKDPVGPSDPIPMPPPASVSKPSSSGRVEDTAPETVSPLEGQERLEAPRDPVREYYEREERLEAEMAASGATEDDVADGIARVPAEHLPSHRARQRWGFSKRLSELMDDLLPKLAVVTQKVNTYTGTDYSGVEALRREIMEHEQLVRVRRAAIYTAKQALDAAHIKQASSQKEVVALLERKHSWSAGDLERYMSLIRSEHINDQAIRQAKAGVVSAEAALEEARTQLEKRERAQYHEEQIWSDTIRRNSTWVTFGLMGVNIFLLLLSLAILEPWRRRRMVREIKSALEAQKMAIGAAPATAIASTAMPTTTPKELAAIEEEIDRVFEPVESSSEATFGSDTEAPPADGAEVQSVVDAAPTGTDIPASVANPDPDAAVPGAAPLLFDSAKSSPQTSIDIGEEVLAPNDREGTLRRWQGKVVAVAQDVVSDRVISLRRIDYTTAILQGAAAGAIITGAIVAILRPN